MRKRMGKLQLHRETLRMLTEGPDLKKAAGGSIEACTYTCYGTCGCIGGQSEVIGSCIIYCPAD